MSISKNRELLMCKLILEHYRYIKRINEISTQEFIEYVYGINPAIYSAFKNKELIVVKNTISDYLTIINKTVKAMTNCYTLSDENAKPIVKRNNDIIRLLYINKKTLSIHEVASKISVDESNFCRYHAKALGYFAELFNRTASRLGYQNALNNIDVRILEIMRLDKQARSTQKIA